MLLRQCTGRHAHLARPPTACLCTSQQRVTCQQRRYLRPAQQLKVVLAPSISSIETSCNSSAGHCNINACYTASDHIACQCLQHRANAMPTLQVCLPESSQACCTAQTRLCMPEANLGAQCHTELPLQVPAPVLLGQLHRQLQAADIRSGRYKMRNLRHLLWATHTQLAGISILLVCGSGSTYSLVAW